MKKCSRLGSLRGRNIYCLRNRGTSLSFCQKSNLCAAWVSSDMARVLISSGSYRPCSLSERENVLSLHYFLSNYTRLSRQEIRHVLGRLDKWIRVIVHSPPIAPFMSPAMMLIVAAAILEESHDLRCVIKCICSYFESTATLHSGRKKTFSQKDKLKLRARDTQLSEPPHFPRHFCVAHHVN